MKWLNNLRAGHGCESCYAPTRAAIGDLSRFSQADAEAIAISIGLTPTGAYVNALTPFPCRCGRCGRDVGPRLGDITAKLRAGRRVFGCEPCAHLQVGIDSRTSEAEIRDDLLAAGVEYLDGYVNTQISVRGRCLTCERIVSVRPAHVRAGHSGCFNCAASGYFSLTRLKRRTDLAQRPAYLYLVEFVDFNGTTFHKIGISTTENRIHRHTVLCGGVLLARQDENLLVCCQAEQLILRHVARRAYRPGQGRIKGGDTECFLPGEPIDLPQWIAAARDLTAPSSAMSDAS
jgi:hypothetical protein